MLRKLVGALAPTAPVPEPIAPLSISWLLDVDALHQLQLKALEERQSQQPNPYGQPYG